jgi:hypothetical protein
VHIATACSGSVYGHTIGMVIFSISHYLLEGIRHFGYKLSLDTSR